MSVDDFADMSGVTDDLRSVGETAECLCSMKMLGQGPEVRGYLPPMNWLHVYMTEPEPITEEQIRAALEQGRREADAFLKYQDCRIPGPGQRYV